MFADIYGEFGNYLLELLSKHIWEAYSTNNTSNILYEEQLSIITSIVHQIKNVHGLLAVGQFAVKKNVSFG